MKPKASPLSKLGMKKIALNGPFPVLILVSKTASNKETVLIKSTATKVNAKVYTSAEPNSSLLKAFI